MHECHELRNYALHLVGDEHLVAVQLDAVALDVDVALDFREIQYAGQSERVVHVEVNPEHRLFKSRHEFVIELDIVLVFQVGRLLGP